MFITTQSDAFYICCQVYFQSVYNTFNKNLTFICILVAEHFHSISLSFQSDKTTQVEIVFRMKSVKRPKNSSIFAETETYLLDLSIHIQVNAFGSIGGGARAHDDLALLFYTPAEILAWSPD